MTVLGAKQLALAPAVLYDYSSQWYQYWTQVESGPSRPSPYVGRIPWRDAVHDRKWWIRVALIWSLMIGLVILSLGMSAAEAWSDRRPHGQVLNLVDIGFLVTTPVHTVLVNNPLLNHILAGLNTLFVLLIYVYAIVYLCFTVGRPGILILGISLFVLRLFCGFLTQLPFHPEYLTSLYDFPQIINGSDDVPFHFFYSGHATLGALMAMHAYHTYGFKACITMHVLNALQCIRLLATRGHWSIDIVIGMVLGTLIHAYVNRMDEWIDTLTITKLIRYSPSPKVGDAHPRRVSGGNTKRKTVKAQ
jgi:hypothetical protein